jgi:hypothetical protein
MERQPVAGLPFRARSTPLPAEPFIPAGGPEVPRAERERPGAARLAVTTRSDKQTISEEEITEFKIVGKFDEKTFAKPEK